MIEQFPRNLAWIIIGDWLSLAEIGKYDVVLSKTKKDRLLELIGGFSVSTYHLHEVLSDYANFVSWINKRKMLTTDVSLFGDSFSEAESPFVARHTCCLVGNNISVDIGKLDMSAVNRLLLRNISKWNAPLVMGKFQVTDLFVDSCSASVVRESASTMIANCASLRHLNIYMAIDIRDQVQLFVDINPKKLGSLESIKLLNVRIPGHTVEIIANYCQSLRSFLINDVPATDESSHWYDYLDFCMYWDTSLLVHLLRNCQRLEELCVHQVPALPSSLLLGVLEHGHSLRYLKIIARSRSLLSAELLGQVLRKVAKCVFLPLSYDAAENTLAVADMDHFSVVHEVQCEVVIPQISQSAPTSLGNLSNRIRSVCFEYSESCSDQLLEAICLNNASTLRHISVRHIKSLTCRGIEKALQIIRDRAAADNVETAAAPNAEFDTAVLGADAIRLIQDYVLNVYLEVTLQITDTFALQLSSTVGRATYHHFWKLFDRYRHCVSSVSFQSNMDRNNFSSYRKFDEYLAAALPASVSSYSLLYSSELLYLLSSKHTASITALSLSEVNDSDARMEQLLSRVPQLHSLSMNYSLSESGKITDKTVALIGKHCRRLTDLKLGDLPKVTRKSVVGLILTLPLLENILVLRCWKDTRAMEIQRMLDEVKSSRGLHSHTMKVF